jgi:hypothetical protein
MNTTLSDTMIQFANWNQKELEKAITQPINRRGIWLSHSEKYDSVKTKPKLRLKENVNMYHKELW